MHISLKRKRWRGQRALNEEAHKSLPAGSRLGIESTGGYRELLAEMAHKRGLVVFTMQERGIALQDRRVDAQLIARMVLCEHEKLHPWIPPTPEQRQVDRLLKRRTKVSRIRVALSQSLKELAGFRADLKTVNERLERLIKRIDAKVKALIGANEDRQQQYARLRKIAGLGGVVVRSAMWQECRSSPTLDQSSTWLTD